MNSICSKNDMIAALATPYGRSALAVIRISGKGCIEKVSAFLTKPLKPEKLKLNTFVSGEFTENLTAVCYRAPHSYTGEDVVELITHGNPIVVDGVIKALTDGGVRLAERGEFTERAFSAGKIDLTGCEALADIIDAETAEQLKYANARFNGEFTGLKKVESLLVTALGDIEAMLHYVDELEKTDIDGELPTEILAAIDSAIDILTQETESYNGGRILSSGLKVALVGAPNVGKSTLLNALIGADRAIVTDQAGTTRDTVEGAFIYKGRKFIVIDTAGLNDNATDKVEMIGIERAKKAAESADVVIRVTAADIDRQAEIAATFTVENKHDELTGDENAKSSGDLIKISAKNGVNLTAVKQKLYELCPKNVGEICNHRQYGSAVRCLDACRQARKEWEKPDGMEIVAAALYEACSAIAELYGEQADEKVISSVFERFCVGK